jgi:hypothetical protein
MNAIVKNSLAVVSGFVVGSVVNMGIITISGSIIPPPNGADNTNMEGLIASMHLFEPKHFVFPFLAHALGTFIGALLAAKIAVNHKMIFAMSIALLFLIGGIANCVLLPSPLWYTIVDLSAAYIPMGYFAARLVIQSKED